MPDDLLQATRMTAEELKREIAVLLFQQDRLTLS
jgi:predicted HTH domain antitoxin